MAAKNHIYILGDGIIGALSAAYISRRLPKELYDITYFDNGSSQKTDYLYGTCHADTRRLNNVLNLKEAGQSRRRPECVGGL